MAFEIKGKIALISGGASGIGLMYAKELLRNGLRGVTLADINEEYGKKALKDIEDEFGPNKAIFVVTDVMDKNSFEEAFKKTLETYKNLDILINNAGILNDNIWEKEVAINLNGTINGVLLALENYIPKYKTALEGVIVNVSSVAALQPASMFPIYTATKCGILGMTKAFGCEDHYKRTRVKVVSLCPGGTETPMLTEVTGIQTLGQPYEVLLEPIIKQRFWQKPESVATAMVDIIKNAKSGSIWVAENDSQPYEFIYPTNKNYMPNNN